MQVEVTKYTEGKADRETRPNALPVSLIKYDGMDLACLEMLVMCTYMTSCCVCSPS